VAAFERGTPGEAWSLSDVLTAHGGDQVTVTEGARRSGVEVDFVTRDRCSRRNAKLGNGPTVQLWPHRHGTDAMFLAVLRRTS
jgi:16S rRNA C967 or C1407 C5-methylase (RsmB/RsmF family)